MADGIYLNDRSYWLGMLHVFQLQDVECNQKQERIETCRKHIKRLEERYAEQVKSG